MKKYCPRCMEPLSNGICKNGCAPVFSSDTRVLQPGTVLYKRYLVGRALGQGGFGITYIGRDLTLETCVAIKEYFPKQMVIRDTSISLEIQATSPQMTKVLSQGYEKFLKEARSLARFRGEKGIVEVLDFFQENNTAYIVMEYIDGQTLKDYLGESGKLPPNEVFSLMKPVMGSLSRLHQEGLIHRDISPDNIMLTSDNQVKLLDFGTVRNANLDGENTLTVMLKHGYAPEEQYDRKSRQGPWTDVYALCATMYRCITGIVPENALLRYKHDPVQPPSQLGVAISPAWEAALMKGLACDYQDRFQSVGALAAALYGDDTMPLADARDVSRPERDRIKSGGVFSSQLRMPADKPSPPEAPSERFTPAPPEPEYEYMNTGSTMPCYVLMSDRPDHFVGKPSEYRVFGSNYTRDQISTITFHSPLSRFPNPDNAWDVSQAQDGSVMAWVSSRGGRGLLDLHVGAVDGHLVAPDDCCGLFAKYINVTSIHFTNGFDTWNTTDMGFMFHECRKLKELDVSRFDTSRVTNMMAMFFQCNSIEMLDVSRFDTSRATNMRSMFSECGSLKMLDVSRFNTANVTDMKFMFNKCSSLEILDVSGFSTAKVTGMKAMFQTCSSIKTLDVSNFDTASVTDMETMFSECGSIKTLDVSHFNTANVTDMGFMFNDCSNLTALDVSGFNTSKVTNMKAMFQACGSIKTLDVSHFNTANVTDMGFMFNDCSGLEMLNVSSFDTSKVTNMMAMFQACAGIKLLNASSFDTADVTDMSYMFNKCVSLSSLDARNFDTTKVTDMRYMFGWCGKLRVIHVRNWNTSNANTEGMFNACSLSRDIVSYILSDNTVST